MFDFFKTLFKPPAASGETAKERLRLVLLSDHLSLAPDVVESLKRDLMEVISRYVEIDMAHADVTFEHREREIAMLANIPITGVRERKAAQPVPSPAPKPAPGSVARLESQDVAEAPAPAPERAATSAAQAVTSEPSSTSASVPAAAAPAHAATASSPRRRRRKKYSAAAAAAAATKRAAQQQLGGQASAQA